MSFFLNINFTETCFCADLHSVENNSLLQYDEVYLLPLTSSSKAEKTSRPVFPWTPQRYYPELFWVKLVMVTVNFLDAMSSVSVNCPFCLVSEEISACCRHVEGWFPLQMYLRLFWYSDSYGQLKDTELSS